MRKVWACAIGAVVSAMCAGGHLVYMFLADHWFDVWDYVLMGSIAVMFIGLSGTLLALGLERYLDDFNAEDEDEEDE